MSKAKQIEQPQPEMYLVIKCGRTQESVKCWQYYSIVNIVRQLGMKKPEADDLAKWARTAHDGERWQNSMMDIVAVLKTESDGKGETKQ